MFERRLKIFLGFLIVATIALICRAVQIQVVERADWQKRAADFLRRPELIETTRGSILDRNGKVLAVDAPCIDACVDYRALTDEPDQVWVTLRAKDNLRAHLGDDDYAKAVKSERWPEILAEEVAAVNDQISKMWGEIASVCNKKPEEIEAARQAVVTRVMMRQRYLWWRHYQNSVKGAAEEKSEPWYEQLVGDDKDIDDFQLDVAEQTQAHMIVHDITPEMQVALSGELDHLPGLVLRPSKMRLYNYGDVACHVLGHLTQVSPDQIKANPPSADELRGYWPSDLIGEAGIEALCEKTLRGSRGRIEKVAGSSVIESTVPAVPGRDVKTTIDIDLEMDCQKALQRQRIHVDANNVKEVRSDQHGAVVVLDVATGQVLALVSNPGFDVNQLDQNYAQLSRDEINLPLLDRATQMAVEPGSTVKPMVGSGAITSGKWTPTQTVTCNGVLVIDDKPQAHGHCWTFEVAKLNGIAPSHALMPPESDTAEDAIVNNQLTITDGIERSCNVVFETVADRMGMELLCHWYREFGLGSPTGVGLDESAGRLFDPSKATGNPMVRMQTWSAGIGEGVVNATPIQMADSVATVARDGIWLRPQLVSKDDVGRASTRPVTDLGPDRRDLHLSPEALAAVQKGMYRVVNAPGGSGPQILYRDQDDKNPDERLAGITVAGKTGTAQGSQLSFPRRDAGGNIMYDDKHNMLFDKVELGTPGTETWYQANTTTETDSDGKVVVTNHYDHAWYIGYAPLEHPQVAFCVFVEYGAAGGRVAGAIAHDVLVSCVDHGYLKRPNP
jgi:penicillin-binding protein 2